MLEHLLADVVPALLRQVRSGRAFDQRASSSAARLLCGWLVASGWGCTAHETPPTRPDDVTAVAQDAAASVDHSDAREATADATSGAGPDATDLADRTAPCSTCLVPAVAISDGSTVRAGQNVHISAAAARRVCGPAIASWVFWLRAPGADSAEERRSEAPYLSIALQQPGEWQICLALETAEGEVSCTSACTTVQVVAKP